MNIQSSKQTYPISELYTFSQLYVQHLTLTFPILIAESQSFHAICVNSKTIQKTRQEDIQKLIEDCVTKGH